MVYRIVGIVLKNRYQIDNERRLTAEVPHLAALQILYFESDHSGVVGVGFEPKPEREKMGAVGAEFVH